MEWYVTGDIHGRLDRFKYYDYELKQNSDCAIIILGDASFNYFLDERDAQLKRAIVRKYKCQFYCVRGNHEARPQDIPTMQLVYDENVKGEVYVEQEYPNIKYFKDWGIYNLNGFVVLVIGGAYSVDKYYRLTAGSGWFPNEQLSKEERTLCFDEITGGQYDFVLTHACPYQWLPEDLFLPMINQGEVDKTTERFLERIRQTITYEVWLFGHYHADRIERPRVEMFYRNTEKLNDIWERWQIYKTDTTTLPWSIQKSPRFWMGNE